MKSILKELNKEISKGYILQEKESVERYNLIVDIRKLMIKKFKEHDYDFSDVNLTVGYWQNPINIKGHEGIGVKYTPKGYMYKRGLDYHGEYPVSCYLKREIENKKFIEDKQLDDDIKRVIKNLIDLDNWVKYKKERNE